MVGLAKGFVTFNSVLKEFTFEPSSDLESGVYTISITLKDKNKYTVSIDDQDIQDLRFKPFISDVPYFVKKSIFAR